MDTEDQRLNTLFERLDEKQLLLLRSIAFGGAAAALAVLLVITQVGLKDGALTVGLAAAMVAMPCWVASASMYEALIFFGPSSRAILRSSRLRRLMTWMHFAAGMAIALSVGALAWHLSVIAATIFAVVCLAAALGVSVFNDSAQKARGNLSRE